MKRAFRLSILAALAVAGAQAVIAVLPAGATEGHAAEGHAAAPARAPGADERAELRAIQARGLEENRKLLARLRALPDGAERREWMRRAVQLKHDTELSRLRTSLEFARRAGDAERQAALERAIAQRQGAAPAGPGARPEGREAAKKGPR